MEKEQYFGMWIGNNMVKKGTDEIELCMGSAINGQVVTYIIGNGHEPDDDMPDDYETENIEDYQLIARRIEDMTDEEKLQYMQISDISLPQNLFPKSVANGIDYLRSIGVMPFPEAWEKGYCKREEDIT